MSILFEAKQWSEVTDNFGRARSALQIARMSPDQRLDRIEEAVYWMRRLEESMREGFVEMEVDDGK